MIFIRKSVTDTRLSDIAPGECFRFPGTNTRAYMRLADCSVNVPPDCHAYVSMESGLVERGGAGMYVIAIDVELREL